MQETTPPQDNSLPDGIIDFDLEAYIPFLLHQAHRGTMTYFESGLRPLDVSLPEWRAMAVLAHHGRMRFGDLAQNAGLEPPTLARLLKTLEAKGWVTRQPSPEDGRGTDIALTPTGRDKTHAILPLARQASGRLLQGLSTDEQELLRRLLRRVQGNMNGGAKP